MNCLICKSKKVSYKFDAVFRKKYFGKYYFCNDCNFLWVDKPSWLKEAYKNPINVEDTGLLSRNIYLSNKLSLILFFLFDRKKRFLDYAGGYGVFTRLMRDKGFDFYTHDFYTKNIFAIGFDGSLNKKYELVTCFECLEHLDNPLNTINELFNISKNIIFSTELLSINIPKPKDWEYYGLSHGQHISFYSNKTLKFIAKQKGVNYLSIGDIHIFSEKKINWLCLKILFKFSYFFNFLINKKLISKIKQDSKINSKRL